MSEDHNARTPQRKGYWRWVLEFSMWPTSAERTGFEYFFLGAMILFTPIVGPLYYLGVIGEWALERLTTGKTSDE